MPKTPAQLKAQRKYDKKVGARPVIQIRCTQDEKDQATLLFDQLEGTKIKLLIEGLELILKSKG